ncbi:hypothetical protein RDI58_025049 [Solanum bulbocastanum]|uniref:Uncharacterized protein n=1 Tax=Solanum bulbocastanum TaxID=147425 RepID=A0AAN8Y480_SOLBU
MEKLSEGRFQAVFSALAVILRYSSVFWSDFIRLLLRLTSLMGDKKKAGTLFVRLVSTAGAWIFLCEEVV